MSGAEIKDLPADLKLMQYITKLRTYPRLEIQLFDLHGILLILRSLISGKSTKVVCVFPMFNWSEFRIGQYPETT